jgi:hypothetical protein
MRFNPCWVGQLREQGLAASRRLLDELGHCEIQLGTLAVKYGQHRASNRNRPRNENFLCAGGAVRSARLTGSRGLTRRSHRPPAIERHLLEQAAMFIPPMSALQRIPDSGLTASRVRKVPTGDIARREALLSSLEHVQGETIGVNLAIEVGPKAIHLVALDIFNGHQRPS